MIEVASVMVVGRPATFMMLYDSVVERQDDRSGSRFSTAGN
jgi:hypothetical protein